VTLSNPLRRYFEKGRNPATCSNSASEKVFLNCWSFVFEPLESLYPPSFMSSSPR